MKNQMKRIWGRAGVTFLVTDAEAVILLDHEADGTAIAQVICKIVSEGRFIWDGNSYIPAESITEFNHKYGTDFDDDGEPEWEF